MKITTLFLFSSLILLATTNGSSQATPCTSDSPAPVERVLDNGTHALLWPRPGSGTVLLTVAVPAGSQNEEPSMAGLSHYLEHLLFDGFDRYDERGVTEAFELHSAYVNAFTRDQATIFFALAPAGEAEATAKLLKGMLTRSKIVPATYEKERKVILEELAKDNANPAQVREERLRGALWRGTPLERPVGGTEKTVAATDRESVVRYWKKRYGPSSWRVLVTGDLPLEGLNKVLDAMTPLETTPPLPAPGDPLDWPGWGEWEAIHVSGGNPGHGMMGGPMAHLPQGGSAENGTLALLLAAPEGLPRTEAEILARWLGDPKGKLSSALIPELADSLSVSLQPRFIRDVLRIDIDAAAGVTPRQLLSALMGALEASATGPDDATVLRIQRALQAERVLTGQRLHYAAMFYGEALLTAAEQPAWSLDPPEVDGAAVRRAAGQLLDHAAGRMRAAWVGPGGPEHRSALPEAAPVTVKGESERVFHSGPFSSRITTLQNGLVLGVLPEMGADVFGIHLLVADRSLREPEDLPGVADYLHRLLAAGTAVSSSAALSRRLERAGIELKLGDSPMIPFDNRYHVPDFSYVRMEGPARSLETGLEILAEMIRQPQWDEDGIRRAGRVHQQSQEADNRGASLASRKLYAAILGPDHPLARPVSGPPGELPDLEKVHAFMGRWPEGYFAPDRLVLTLASPKPEDTVLEMVEDLFGGGTGHKPQRGPYPDTTAGNTTPSSGVTSPQITMLWGRKLEIPPGKRSAFLVAVDALSDRMVAVIREREGLAYRLGAGVRELPGGGWMLVAQVGTRPDNEARVKELMQELITKLTEQPLPAEELQRLAARQRRSDMLRSLSAASRAYRLGRALFEGEESPLRIPAADRADIEPEQVQEIARGYFDLDAMRLVIAP